MIPSGISSWARMPGGRVGISVVVAERETARSTGEIV